MFCHSRSYDYLTTVSETMSGNATGFSPETLIQTSNENTLSYFNLLVQKVIEVKSLNYIKKKNMNKQVYVQVYT